MFWGNILPSYSTTKRAAVYSYEMFVSIYQITWCHDYNIDIIKDLTSHDGIEVVFVWDMTYV
jgi:hypothetical protein